MNGRAPSTKRLGRYPPGLHLYGEKNFSNFLTKLEFSILKVNGREKKQLRHNECKEYE